MFGFIVGVEIRIQRTKSAFKYSKIQISSKWLVILKKNAKKKKKRNKIINIKREFSCCEKLLVLKSSIKIKTKAAKKKIRLIWTNDSSKTLLKRVSNPKTG